MRKNFQVKRIGVACAVVWLAIGLNGCETITQANKDVNDAKAGIEAANLHAATEEQTPTISSTSESWLLGQTLAVTVPDSPILTTKVSYCVGHKVSLSDVASFLTQNYGLPVDISDLTGGNGFNAGGADASALSASSSLPGSPTMLPLPSPSLVNAAAKANSSASRLPDMQLCYDGMIKGLLEVVAEKEGVWQKFEDDRVQFYRTMTKTIYMPAIARHDKGTSSIIASGGPQMGNSTGQQTSSSGDNGNSGSSASSSDYDLDVWKAIGDTAQTVAGGKGQSGAAIVTASAALGGVTVTGTPTQVRHVEEWARNLSENMSQLVKVSITLYTVTLNHEDNYSWNPDLAFQKLGSAYGLTLVGPTVPPIAAAGVSGFSLGAKVASTSSNALAGSSVVYNALSTLGKVSSVKTWSTLSLNNQVSKVQMASQVTYAAQSGATATANVGTTSTLTPGVVTTGLTGTLRPSIVNGKITLAMDLTDSVLNRIDTFTSNGAEIQLPNVSVSALPSSIALAPGQSMLATGVTETNGTITQNGTFVPNNPLLGGGTGATRGQTLVVVKISAEVM
jgi:type IVB pilus formation R64 PilN family outer membrane protein